MSASIEVQQSAREALRAGRPALYDRWLLMMAANTPTDRMGRELQALACLNRERG